MADFLDPLTDLLEQAEQASAESGAHPSSSAEDTRGAVTRPEALAELRRIIASGDFRASPRNRRVLAYLVQCKLDGREDDISSYAIATKVFGRPEDFSPSEDPIVRIEMAHLRSGLEMYYLKSGAKNPLRITIPKGTYVPEFFRFFAPADASSGTCSAASPLLVAFLRAAFAGLGGDRRRAAMAWQELVLSHPSSLGNLHQAVLQEIGDGEVASLVVNGLLRAAGRSSAVPGVFAAGTAPRNFPSSPSR